MEILKNIGIKSIEGLINKILQSQESGEYHVETVMLNGQNRYIDFFIHFQKFNPQRMRSFIRKTFNLDSNKLPFPSNYDVSVYTDLGEDITQNVMEYPGLITYVDFDRLIKLQNHSFTIHAQGTFNWNFLDILRPISRPRESYEDIDLKKFNFKLVFLDSLFIAKKIQFLSIPAKIDTPIHFVNKEIYKRKILELRKRILNAKPTYRGLYRLRQQFEDYMKITFEAFIPRVEEFIQHFQNRIDARFHEFLRIESNKSIEIVKVQLTRRMFHQEIPKFKLLITILADYRDSTDSLIDGTIVLLKEPLIRIAKKSWKKFFPN